MKKISNLKNFKNIWYLDVVSLFSMNCFTLKFNELLICCFVKEVIDTLWENQMEENDEDEDVNQLKKEILKKDRTTLTSRSFSLHLVSLS
jgi:hypothetical protein